MVTSRQVALAMLLLSASLVAVAQAVSAGSGASIGEIGFSGMKLSHLIVGTAAAGVSLWFLPKYETKSLGATITCGMLAALLLTPGTLWAYAAYFSTEAHKAAVPLAVENILAAAYGIGGVYIVPMVGSAWKQAGGNPLGFLALLRGGMRQAPPPADHGEEAGEGKT